MGGLLMIVADTVARMLEMLQWVQSYHLSVYLTSYILLKEEGVRYD